MRSLFQEHFDIITKKPKKEKKSGNKQEEKKGRYFRRSIIDNFRKKNRRSFKGVYLNFLASFLRFNTWISSSFLDFSQKKVCEWVLICITQGFVKIPFKLNSSLEKVIFIQG